MYAVVLRWATKKCRTNTTNMSSNFLIIVLNTDLLYRNKIIHCDMKPENVLLKQQGRSGIKVGHHLKTSCSLLFRRKVAQLFSYLSESWELRVKYQSFVHISRTNKQSRQQKSVKNEGKFFPSPQSFTAKLLYTVDNAP